MRKLLGRISLILVAGVFFITANPISAENAGSAPADEQDSANEAYTASVSGETVKDNKRFTLCFDDESYRIKVIDKSTGFVWSSTPENVEDDELAEGINRTNMLSHIVVKYAPPNSEIKVINSMAGSIAYDAASWTPVQDGIRITYRFEREKITVPVEFLLDEDGLTVSIIYSEIEEDTNKIESIELLPYFGASEYGDDGYLLVPDGSGAVVQFNSMKSGITSIFEKRVYGDDLSVPSARQTSRDQTIKLPVFGIKNGNNAFVGVITEGDANALISAGGAGQGTGYYRIYPSGVYRPSGKISLKGQIGFTTDVLFFSREPVTDARYTVKYFFLSKEKANYTGMAEAYRKYLFGENPQAKASGSPQMVIDFYGGAKKQKNFLGFPYQGTEAFTTLTQVQEILDKLRLSGIDELNAGLRDFTSASLNGQPEAEIVPINGFGGRKGLQKLLEYAGKYGIDVFPHVDMLYFRKSGSGVRRRNDAVYSLQQSPLKLYPYGTSTNMPDKSAAAVYLLKSAKYGMLADRILKNSERVGLQNLSVGEASSGLASDFAVNGGLREQSLTHARQALGKLSGKGRLMTASANSYLFDLSDILADMPLGSGKHLIFDYDVPFLQILLKGFVDYTGEALNFHGMSEEYFLRHIEAGAHMKFAAIYEDSRVLRDTDSLFLSGAHYTAWTEKALQWYGEAKAVAKAVGQSNIISHEKNGDIVKIGYSNGLTIYVNYSDADASVPDAVIPARGYLISD